MIKQFMYFTANGTDGTDPALIDAVFQVTLNGTQQEVRIPSDQADGGASEEAAIYAALGLTQAEQDAETTRQQARANLVARGHAGIAASDVPTLSVIVADIARALGLVD